MPESKEPKVIINGYTLNEAEAMVIRCALENYAWTLSDPDSLGNDEHGKTMRALYFKTISSIRKKMYQKGI